MTPACPPVSPTCWPLSLLLFINLQRAWAVSGVWETKDKKAVFFDSGKRCVWHKWFWPGELVVSYLQLLCVC